MTQQNLLAPSRIQDSVRGGAVLPKTRDDDIGGGGLKSWKLIGWAWGSNQYIRPSASRLNLWWLWWRTEVARCVPRNKSYLPEKQPQQQNPEVALATAAIATQPMEKAAAFRTALASISVTRGQLSPQQQHALSRSRERQTSADSTSLLTDQKDPIDDSEGFKN